MTHRANTKSCKDATASRAIPRALVMLALAAALLVGFLAAPSVSFLLPNTESAHPEVYQPLKTLKFFKNRGQEYHKYGPMTNFALAPGYAVTLGWWYVRDKFKNPSDRFPYGLTQPAQQLGALILQGRLLFLLLGLAALAWLVLQTRFITPSLVAIAGALALIVVTDPYLAQRLPIVRPDSLLFTFVTVLLGLYIRTIYLGVTRKRLILISVVLMLAVSSKEIAGAIFALPCLGIVALLVRDVRAGHLRAATAVSDVILAALAGIATYAVFNVIYAPGVWLERMQFWLFGWNPSGIWDTGLSNDEVTGWWVFTDMLGELLSHLGIGGSIIALIGIGACFVFRPRGWFYLLLPLASYLFLGLWHMGYVPATQYFITLPVLVLLPVCAGLGALLLHVAARRGMRRALIVAAVTLIGADALHATLAWHGLDLRFPQMRDSYVRENVSRTEHFGYVVRTPQEPGRVIYDTEGYNFDRRNLTQLMDAPANERPTLLLVERGGENWLLDAKRWRARAQLLLEEDGVDVDRFDGVPALGYRLEEEITGKLPSWYPYTWMRRTQWILDKRALRVYVRDDA